MVISPVCLSRNVFRYVITVMMTAILVPGICQAEIYLGAMGGISIPSDFSDVTSSGRFPDMPLPDVGLGVAPMAGIKIGTYLPDYNWFGIETEGYFTNPKFESFEAQGVDANLQVATWAFNAIFRYPGERFQPYLGAGVGLYFPEIESDDLPGPSLSQSWVPGFNILGGVRGFVTNSLALFLEYKYNRATFDMRTTIFGSPFGFEGTFTNNIVAAGLAWHFR